MSAEEKSIPDQKKNDSTLLANSNSLELSEDVVKYLGIENPSTPLRFVMNGNKLEIQANIHSLSKVYIEPTAKCNLNCKTCVRGTWKEKMGSMDLKTFDILIDQLKEFKNLQSVMFGGIGEPTFHQDILYMVKQVKSLKIKAEMVTNGTLLSETMLRELGKNGLDTLWISFDGASLESFEDIRSGADFGLVLENLKRFKAINGKNAHKIKIGIAFVAMKRNIEELGKLSSLSREIGAKLISISNVIPYSQDMLDQMLCVSAVNQLPYGNGLSINLPFIDWTEKTLPPLIHLLRGMDNIQIMHNNRIDREQNSCRFIKDRCTIIKWDGNVSPCMGLLHSYKTYFASGGIEREVTSYTLGNIRERVLKEIWYSDEYQKFRERVDKFDFSPCLRCGPCNYAEKNMEDCFGNNFPTCGGCLWAQGLVQCP